MFAQLNTNYISFITYNTPLLLEHLLHIVSINYLSKVISITFLAINIVPKTLITSTIFYSSLSVKAVAERTFAMIICI